MGQNILWILYTMVRGNFYTATYQGALAKPLVFINLKRIETWRRVVFSTAPSPMSPSSGTVVNSARSSTHLIMMMVMIVMMMMVMMVMTMMMMMMVMMTTF